MQPRAKASRKKNANEEELKIRRTRIASIDTRASNSIHIFFTFPFFFLLLAPSSITFILPFLFSPLALAARRRCGCVCERCHELQQGVRPVFSSFSSSSSSAPSLSPSSSPSTQSSIVWSSQQAVGTRNVLDAMEYHHPPVIIPSTPSNVLGV